MKSNSEQKTKIFSKLEQIDFQPFPLKKPNFTNLFRKFSKIKRTDYFIRTLEKAKAQVFLIEKKELKQKIEELLKMKSYQNLIYSKSTLLKKIVPALKKDSRIQIHSFDKNYDDFKETLYSCDLSITEANWGICETATLVIWSSPEQPRSLSLIPPTHLCILQEENIHSDFESLANKEQWTNQMPANAIFVSGPSRTADIEFNISLGIHGPKELILLILR